MMRLALLVLLVAASFVAQAQRTPGATFDHFTTGFDLEGAHLTLPCESCHVAGVFQGTPTECGACHSQGGLIQAEAKPVDHVRSTELCSDCHRTTTWVPLAQMNHDSIYGSCTTCHNNVQSVGMPPQHPQTRLECDTCHRTTAWLPASFDHSDVTQPCGSCHDGVAATGKSPGHFGTQLECDSCHNPSAWALTAFTHSSPNYPGDHAGRPTCTACHTSNAETVPWPFPAYAPDCAACHASDYKPSAHLNAPVSQLRDCAGSCHRPSPEHSVRSREW